MPLPLSVNITVSQRHDIGRPLNQQRFDLGLVALPVVAGPMQIEHLASIGAVCLTHETHPLAGEQQVDVHEMFEHVFIAPGRATLLVRRLEDVLAREGLSLHAHMTVETTAVIQQLVMRNLGISIGHAFSELDSPPGVVARRIVPEIPLDYALLLPEKSRRTENARLVADRIRARIAAFTRCRTDISN